MIIALLLLLCPSILLLYYYVIYHGRFWQLIFKLPGLPAYPIIGHTIEFATRSASELWTFLRTNSNKYYPIHKLWYFSIVFVSIRHPDDLEKILSNSKQHLSKGYIYSFLHSWLGTGLLTSEGAKWHERRKILTPTFHFYMLKQFADVLIEEGNRMTKSLKDIEGSTINNLVLFISQHTLNAICETAMGTSLQSTGEFEKAYRHAVHETGEIMIERLVKPWYQFDMIFALTPLGRRQTKNLKILHEFTEKIIAERRKYHEMTGGKYLKIFENNTVKEIDDDIIMGGKKKRLAMLDLMIAASRNNEMNDLDIREEVDTFMFEGHDTVAMAITYTLVLLAEHKDIQDHVRNEVDAVMQENEGKLTMAALQNLPYLERCLKEAMRLFPSVPVVSRVLSEDVKLQSYLVPAGALLHINIHDVHRDPNFWPNPDVFDPDRFLPDRIQNRHPYSYIPFSAGPRNCIGQRFAMLELKALVAPIVRNFYLEPIDHSKDFQFIVHVISRTVNPIRIKFIPVEYM